MKKVCDLSNCYSILDTVECLLLERFAEGNHALLLPGLGEIPGDEVSKEIRKGISEQIDEMREAIKKSRAIGEQS